MSLGVIKSKIKKLSASSGVYLFKDKAGEILYIGKAASLKSRVRSYFGKNLAYERPIEFVMDQVASFETRKTDSVIEAYFLEQELIKKHQPKYNVLGKDDKSFVYVCITREDFPRFEVKRKTDLAEFSNDDFRLLNNGRQNSKSKNAEYSKIYGPYGARYQVETALRILKRIFPYHSKKQPTEKGCLDYQIGLCPGPYEGMITKTDYAKNIRGIEMIFKGKKKMLIKVLEKEMREFAKNQEFEKAIEKRNQIFSLRHIQDVSMINNKQENGNTSAESVRIEAYDISNISGKFCVGAMVVFDNSDGEFGPNKSQYRKFKVRTVEGIDDVAAMKEVLARRFGNNWPFPDLVVLDGGKGHLNMAVKVFLELGIKIPVVGVAKGPTRKKLDILIDKNSKKLLNKQSQEVLSNQSIIANLRDEAHRFAISYHKKLRGKSLKNN